MNYFCYSLEGAQLLLLPADLSVTTLVFKTQYLKVCIREANKLSTMNVFCDAFSLPEVGQMKEMASYADAGQ